MLKRGRIQILDDRNELDLTYRNFDDKKEEIASIEAKDPAKLTRLFLNATKMNQNNAQKLFEFLETCNFEIITANDSEISNLSNSLANNMTWTRLKLLQLNNSSLGNEGVFTLAQNKTWNELKILRLANNLVGNSAAIKLGENTTWKSLRVLDLSSNQIAREGAIGLAKNESWSELVELDLQNNLLDDEGSFAIGRNSTWKKLDKLHVVKGNAGITAARRLIFQVNCKVSTGFNQELEERKEEDLEELINEKELQFQSSLKQLLNECKDERRAELIEFCGARSRTELVGFDSNGIKDVNKEGHLMWLPQLENLKLAGFGINIEGIELISKNRSWINLKKADFSRTVLNEKHAGILTANSAWTRLEELTLDHNHLRDNGVTEIGRNTSWTHLRILNLSDNLIGEEGCRGLSLNTSWRFLQELNLEINNITDKGASYLTQNSVWKNLEEINLNTNQLSSIHEVHSLVKHENWKDLKRIYLNYNSISREDFALFFENHPAKILPRVEIEVPMRLYCLNLKYVHKFTGITSGDDSLVNEIDREFKEELNEIIQASQGFATKTWESFLECRSHQTVNASLFTSEGFGADNLHLQWFPETIILDLGCYFTWRETNKFTEEFAALVSVLRKSLWVNLEELYLHQNNLGDKEAAELVKTENFKNLRIISLCDNYITDEGALCLLKDNFWKKLEELDLRGNMIMKYKTVIQLAANPNWENLKVLQVSYHHQFKGERGRAAKGFPKVKIEFSAYDGYYKIRDPVEWRKRIQNYKFIKNYSLVYQFT